MKTVTPKQSFTGYPDNQRTEFVAGVPVPVSADYAEILLAKGLIEKPKAKKPAPDAEE